MVVVNERAKRPNVLPEEVERWLHRWSRRAVGAAFIGLAILGWLTLVTWSAVDPALQGQPSAHNLLGVGGAIVGDLLFQSFGLAAVFLLVPVGVIGLDLCRLPIVPNMRRRLLIWPLAGASLAMLFAAAPTPTAWRKRSTSTIR